MSVWMDNAMDPGRHVLVDMGPVNERRTRDAADRLATIVAIRGNAEIVGNARLLYRIPPRKVAKVITAFPEITEGGAGYCWCTHGWSFDTHVGGAA